MDLGDVYQAVLVEPKSATLLTPNGEVTRLSDLERAYDCIHLFSGKFRTLSRDQIRIFSAMVHRPVLLLRNLFAFEMSIRENTEPIGVDEFCRRTKAFEGEYSVLVTDTETFLQKCGLLRKFHLRHFYIGTDTAGKVLNALGRLGVEALPAKFTIFPRGTKTKPWIPGLMPYNYSLLHIWR